MAERGVSWENMENTKHMEKMQDINEMTLNTLFMIQNTLLVTKKTLLVTQNTLHVNRITQNTLFFNVNGRKNHNMRSENMILGQL